MAPLVTSGLWNEPAFSGLKAKLGSSYIPTLLPLEMMMLQLYLFTACVQCVGDECLLLFHPFISEGSAI